MKTAANSVILTCDLNYSDVDAVRLDAVRVLSDAENVTTLHGQPADYFPPAEEMAEQGFNIRFARKALDNGVMNPKLLGAIWRAVRTGQLSMEAANVTLWRLSQIHRKCKTEGVMNRRRRAKIADLVERHLEVFRYIGLDVDELTPCLGITISMEQVVEVVAAMLDGEGSVEMVNTAIGRSYEELMSRRHPHRSIA